MIYNYNDKKPQLGEGVMVAKEAVLIGDVRIGKDSSVWPNATLRADCNSISIGQGVSVQDNVVIHVGPEHAAVIGDFVTLGHGAILHGATVEEKTLIGMGSIVLDGAHIGTGSIVAAGSVVPPNMVVPPFSQVMGIPAKVVKQLPETHAEHLHEEALGYVGLKNEFLGILDK